MLTFNFRPNHKNGDENGRLEQISSEDPSYIIRGEHAKTERSDEQKGPEIGCCRGFTGVLSNLWLIFLYGRFSHLRAKKALK